MALRVDDPQGAKQRAAEFLAKPFSGPIGVGELAIPAVRGVGGSLLYFLDRQGERGAFHEVDFVPDPEDRAGPDLGLTTIDHVAQVVPQTEFLSWMLYYRAILGSGARGAHRSQRPARPDRQPCADQPRPDAAPAAQRLAGPGARRRDASSSAPRVPVRSTSPLPVATSSLPRPACRPSCRLPVPDNYYDDLAARFGLADADLDRLRQHAVLYDRARGRRALPLLHAQHQRRVLRGARAPRLRSLRRGQRAGASRRPSHARSVRGRGSDGDPQLKGKTSLCYALDESRWAALPAVASRFDVSFV